VEASFELRGQEKWSRRRARSEIMLMFGTSWEKSEGN